MFGVKTTSKTNTNEKASLSEYDIYSFNEAIHYHSYKFLGAHHKVVDKKPILQFTIWALNVEAISLVGDFNDWTLGQDRLDKVSESGLWTIAIPAPSENKVFRYQFALHRMNGKIEYINDPYGRQSDFTDRLASVVTEPSNYRWADSEWIKKRENTELSTRPISILKFDFSKIKTLIREIPSYQELAKYLVNEAVDQGYSHIELNNFFEELLNLTNIQHDKPAKSCTVQYQYFAVSSNLGQAEDFKCLVDYCHRNGVGIIVNLPYFRADACGTLQKLNDFSKNPIRNYYISNAVYWLEEFHIDGFNFAAIEVELQNKHPEYFISFIKDLNEVLHSRSAGIITIAQDGISYPNITKPTYMEGLGFNMKINQQWQKDTLSYFSNENSDLDLITLSSTYSFAENQILSLDEMVLKYINQEDFKGNIKNITTLNNLKVMLAYFFAYPGKKAISSNFINLYTNSLETNDNAINDTFFTSYCQYLLSEIDSPYEALKIYLSDLNDIYKTTPVLFETDFRAKCFEWVSYSMDKKVVSFLRWSKDYETVVLVVLNLSEVDYKNFQVGVPKQGLYLEILNSDNEEYLGSGLGNDDGLYSSKEKYDNHNFSLFMDIGANSAHIFKNVGADLNIFKA